MNIPTATSYVSEVPDMYISYKSRYEKISSMRCSIKEIKITLFFLSFIMIFYETLKKFAYLIVKKHSFYVC